MKNEILVCETTESVLKAPELDLSRREAVKNEK